MGEIGSNRISGAVVAIAAVLIGVVQPAVAGAEVRTTAIPPAAAATVAVTSAASRTTATKVSIRVSASEVDVSTGVTVSGKLYRAVNGDALPGRWVSLYARQHNESSYRKVAQAATKAGGNYVFYLKPTWSTAYQVRFAGGPNRAPSNSSYKDVRVRSWYYLNELAHTNTYSFPAPAPGGGTYSVGGVSYLHSLSAEGLHLDAGYEWDQVARCSKFDTKYGIDDNGSATVGSFQAFWDAPKGSPTSSPTMNADMGQPAQSYTTAIRSGRLILYASANSDSTQGDAVWASARVHCVW
ncbi:hypothetical protein [Nakamurella lactea]|uniref:hypothetical protein n=1 Tax=Nakamurella lactea TaxID=459515 RepID=UPI00048E84E9|nr:hypothetical protein [Nakamurella lactea]